MIAIGEIFSWSAILTTNYLFHAIENSLWAFAAAAAVIAFASGWSAADARGRRFIAAVFLFGATYVAFMVLVDAPMYLSRWHAALAAGRTPLVALDGLREIVAHCRVVHEWSVWREDVAWLSLYFSTAVWLSIFLVHAPALTQMRGDTSVAAPAG